MNSQQQDRQQSLLFLDSDRDLVNILSSFLHLKKIKVAQSKNSREALFKMRNQKFDLILVDPDRNDSDLFFSSLAEFSTHKKPPELMIMTQNLDLTLPSPLNLPLRGVIPKPFELELFWSYLA